MWAVEKKKIVAARMKIRVFPEGQAGATRANRVPSPVRAACSKGKVLVFIRCQPLYVGREPTAFKLV